MKTVWPGMDQMISDYNTLERDLRDLKTVFCCIAYQQDDKILHVPATALAEMPKGIELSITFDRTHDNYVFKCILPGVPVDGAPSESTETTGADKSE